MKRGLLVLMLLWSPLAMAETAATLAAIQQQLQGQRVTSFMFGQERHIALLTRPVLSSGQLEFSGQQGLCWQILQPYATTLLVNDAGVFQIGRDRQRKQLMAGGNPVFEIFAQVYLALFQGNLAQLDRHFSVLPDRQGDDWSIRLVPLPQSPLVWLEQIEIRQTAGVNQLILREKNQDHTLIRFQPVLDGAATGGDACW